MSRPKVTFILPAYNAEKHIAASVNSVFSQTSEDWELIVIDDGSTGGTPVLCDELCAFCENSRVVHTLNRGVAAARNEGVMLSRGEYICFIDSDDLVNPDFVAAVASAPEGCDLVCFAMCSGHSHPEEWESLDGIFVPCDETTCLLRCLNPLPHDELGPRAGSSWGKAWKAQLDP